MLAIVPLNWLAILMAAIVSMVIWYFWYSPSLFGKAWMKSIGMKKDSMPRKTNTKTIMGYVYMFVGTVISVLVISILIHAFGITTFSSAAELALLFWVGSVAIVKLGDVLWEGKKFNYYVINIMYYLVSWIVASWILVTWL